MAALKQFTIKGMAYITGVGICENVPRILSENTVATIDSQSGPLPKLFQWLQQAGNIEIQEMYHTLNCGIGMVLVVNAEDTDAIQKFLQQQGETVYQIDHIRSRHGDEHPTQIN